MGKTYFATATALAVLFQIVSVLGQQNDQLVRDARQGGLGGAGGFGGSPGMPGMPGGFGYDYSYSNRDRDWIKLLLEKYLADSSLPSYRQKPDYLALLSYYYPYYFPAYFSAYGGFGGAGGRGGGGGGAGGAPGMPGY